MVERLRAQVGRRALVGEQAVVAQRLETGDRAVELAGVESLTLEIAAERLRVGKSLAELAAVLT